jgi:hypothetical protein
MLSLNCECNKKKNGFLIILAKWSVQNTKKKIQFL